MNRASVPAQPSAKPGVRWLARTSCGRHWLIRALRLWVFAPEQQQSNGAPPVGCWRLWAARRRPAATALSSCGERQSCHSRSAVKRSERTRAVSSLILSTPPKSTSGAATPSTASRIAQSARSCRSAARAPRLACNHSFRSPYTSCAERSRAHQGRHSRAAGPSRRTPAPRPPPSWPSPSAWRPTTRTRSGGASTSRCGATSRGGACPGAAWSTPHPSCSSPTASPTAS